MAETSPSKSDRTGIPTGDNLDSLAGGEAPQRPAPRPRGATPAASEAELVDDPALSIDPFELEREGDTSNTPSQKTSTHITSTGGEDWLTISLYLKHSDISSLRSKLNSAQEAARRDNNPNDEVAFGDSEFIVSPTGTRLGDRSKGSWMAWRLQSDIGATLLLMDTDEPLGDQPNGSVRIPSRTLMEFGTLPTWKMVMHWFEAMGAELYMNKLSRVDACVDLPGVPVTEFMQPFRDGWVVTRGRTRTEHELQTRSDYSGTKATGFTVGKAPMLVRVYDKLLESSRDMMKLQLLVKNRWGQFPTAATRVEFEIHRQRLQRLGVDSFEDWLEKRGAICEQIAREWFRLTDGPVDRNHADRAKTHPIWELAISAFGEWCGGSQQVELTPLLKGEVDMSRMSNQAVGNFIGIYARIGKPIEDNDQFIRETLARIRDSVKERNMSEEVRRRTLELGNRTSIIGDNVNDF